MPQPGRMRGEHLVREPQPHSDRGTATRPQPRDGLLGQLPGLRTGHSQAAILREERRGLMGTRDQGEGDSVADHIHRRRASRPASAILLPGEPIDPEQSMMMISAVSVSPAGESGAVPTMVTVRMALMSRAPSARYSFWSMSIVKS